MGKGVHECWDMFMQCFDVYKAFLGFRAFAGFFLFFLSLSRLQSLFQAYGIFF